MSKQPLRVQNLTTGAVLVEKGRVANSHWTRLKGLIGVRQLEPGDGLLIAPSNSIHCMFMSIPIDVLYVSADHRVVDIDPGMRPWAIGKPRRRARYVIELPAGSIVATGVSAGDLLSIEYS